MAEPWGVQAVVLDPLVRLAGDVRAAAWLLPERHPLRAADDLCQDLRIAAALRASARWCFFLVRPDAH